MRRRSRSNGTALGEVLPVIKLWLLRILVPLGGHREFICQNGFKSDALAETLGLGHWVDPEDREFNPQTVRAELREIHRKAERSTSAKVIPDCLRQNVIRLAGLIGLSETDCRIFEFATLIHNERLLDDTADFLGHLTSVKVSHALSVILDLPESAIRTSLSSSGVLACSGLVTMDRKGTMLLRNKLDLLSDSLADHVCSSELDPVSLLRQTVAPVDQGTLSIADFHHIDPSLAVLRPYLKEAISTARRGVNIFLYGEPGTGKTELAKALARELECELFEVASEDDDGDPVNGERRLRAYRAAQSFFAKQRSLILFDEVQDVFDDGDRTFGRKSTAQTRKAWINRSLEENPVPTIWLSNSIDCLDAAFVRRFDMVIELPVPPKQQRERILANECGDFLPPTALARIAAAESLAPAVITRAASVVRTIRGSLSEQETSAAFELLVNNTLEAQGNTSLKKHDPNRLPETYNPAYINADNDMAKIAEGLISSRVGRLCLYGPPGTGKTAFGRWLAEKIGAPLIVKRASDLLSKYVGQAEKNIAQAFHAADQEGAVLMIDEVDSFLQDRRNAQRSWEVTEVNEMLTQIESFSGVLVASTNLVKGLDQAALRRFDLKVKFDFMRQDQAWDLYAKYCEQQNLAINIAGLSQRVMRLNNLAPGDFAAVMRQSRFRPFGTANEFLTALESECALKEGIQNSMGFIH